MPFVAIHKAVAAAKRKPGRPDPYPHAAESEAGFVRAFSLLRNIDAAIRLKIAIAIKSKSYSAIDKAIDGINWAPIRAAFRSQYAALLKASAKTEAKQHGWMSKAEDDDLGPDSPDNPYAGAVKWVDDKSLTMVNDLKDNVRESARNILRSGWDDGVTVDQMARQLRDIIPLHPREEQFARNRYEALVSNGYSDSRATELTDKYRGTLIKNRALRIARTETIGAAAEGKRVAWEQAKNTGAVAQDSRLEWSAAPGCCDICEELDGRSISEGDTFFVDGDDLRGPPAHPHCRCSLNVVLGPTDKDQQGDT